MMQQIVVDLRMTAYDLRMTAYDLRPPALTHYGLEKAIRSYAERFMERYPMIRVQWAMVNDEKNLNPDLRFGLFRNFQQALSNVIRHAEARTVQVGLRFDSGAVVLDIQDDGKGFTVPGSWIDLVREGHMGQAGSAERAEALGGKLIVQSSPGGGTLIRTVIPLSHQGGRR